MGRNKILHKIAIAHIILLCACSGAGSHFYKNATDTEEVASASELPMPQIPDSIKNPVRRADYAALHIWDSLDLRSPLANDTTFIEQNFSNYVLLLSYASENGVKESVKRMINIVAGNEKTLGIILWAADHYLDDPNSPMRNESLMIQFLSAYISESAISESKKERYAWRLHMANKNRPGMVAANFAVLKRDGTRSTLHDLVANVDTTMLVFYDPNCEHCKDTMEKLTQKPEKRGWQVLTVDFTEDKELWLQSKGTTPEKWVDVFSLSTDLDGELYEIKATPTLYLLDSKGRVILKDFCL